MNNDAAKGYAMLLGASALWGGNWVAVKMAVSQFSPYGVVTLRTLVSSLVFFLMMRMRQTVHPGREHWPALMVLGAVGVFGFNILQFVGLQGTTAVKGALINAATPMVTALLAAAFLGESLGWRQLFSIGLSFAGVVYLITGGRPAAVLAWQASWGDLFILGAAIAWALYTVIGKKAMTRLSPLVMTAYSSLFASLLFIPAWGLGDGGVWLKTGVWDWTGAAGILFTLLAAVLALLWWNHGVQAVGPSRAAIFMNLLPLFTVIYAVLLLGETLDIHQIIGGLLILAGVASLTLRRRKPPEGAVAKG